MRTLVLGAGAVGGVVGAALIRSGFEAGFLVRAARRAQLAVEGLQVFTAGERIAIAKPPTWPAEAGQEGWTAGAWDIVLVACKAFDLPEAMEAFAPAVGPETVIIPLLNGMAHLDALTARFGARRVVGGYALWAATLDGAGHIHRLDDRNRLVIGELDGQDSQRVAHIARLFAASGIDAAASPQIVREMWEKWVLFASIASATVLLRGTVGDIAAAGASHVPLAMLAEAADIANSNGHPPDAAFLERARQMLTRPGSDQTSSLFRDLEAGVRLEAQHTLGDLLGRAEGAATPNLDLAWAAMRTYEARRGRAGATGRIALVDTGHPKRSGPAPAPVLEPRGE
jgi:2-dehydropantoate 2-reductase